jgi:DNA-binding winged helix-turn-helix (wHTH) protein/tetratricopeptide (TPR) repeat protein
MAAGIIRFADFELERAAYQLRHQGRTVQIERLPLELLFLLAERSGQLVTRDEIYQQIWGRGVFVDPDGAINTAIRKVRRALNDDARRPQFVIRVAGRGYRFADGVQSANLRPTSITSLTRFVGRASEMSRLHAALAGMTSGGGRLALISGEPGIGKSRICAELAAEAEKNCVATLIGHCIEQEGVAYLPIVEILESYVDRTQSSDELRRIMGEEGPEMARLLPKLRRILPDLPPPRESGLEQSRRHLFNSFCNFIARRCREKPTLLIVEDLQWADDSTLALMSYLSQRGPSLPLMVVGTYRVSRADLNPGLTRTLECLVRGRLAIQIRLQGLDSSEVALMLRGLSGQMAPHEVTREFSERTDGNPFFIEELFSHLAEENRLYDAAGQLKEGLKIGEIEVPPNVGLVVGRRLGRLREATNEILAMAAVIGRSFSCELLEAATAVPTESLLDCLDEAEQVGLVRSTSDYQQPRTEFCHELTREVILSQLSAERRKRLHLKVAGAIERIYSDRLEEHYASLAQHYSSDTWKAARYLCLAGHQAMQRSAHVEAVRLLTSGLDLVKGLPETNERDRLELASRIVLGVSLSAAKGLPAPEVERSYNRAVQLSGALGHTEDLFWAQCLLAKSYFMRARMQEAQDLAKKLVELAAGSGDPTQLFAAHSLMGQSSFWLGRPALGHWHLEQAIARCDPQVDRATTSIFGYHPIIPCYGYAAKALWFMGYPRRALDNNQRAESVAEGFGDPDSLLAAMTVAAWFHIFRCEPAIVLERAESATAFAHKHGFPYHAAQSAIMKGWALAHLGHESDGVAQIEAGLAARKATGAEYPPAQFLGWLAEAYGKTGQECKGLRVLEGALATIHWAGDLLFEPELHRLKGELLLMQDSSNWEAATRCCQIAIEMSARLGAKSLELRAKTSLARLLAKRRHSKEALKMLSETYGWFTEGFDTFDLKDANSLLNELRG